MVQDSFSSHINKVKPGRACESIRPGFLLPHNLSLPLSTWAIRGNRCNFLSLYLHLRSTNGRANPDIEATAKHFDCHPRTIRNRLKWLTDQGWITPDKSGYKVLSLNKITLKITGELPGQILIPAHDITMLKKCIIVCLYDYWNAYHRMNEGKPNRLSTIHSGGIATSVVRLKTGLSRWWTCHWQKVLEEAGLIKVERENVEAVDFTPENLDTERSGTDPEGFYRFRKAGKRVVEIAANKISIIVPISYLFQPLF